MFAVLLLKNSKIKSYFAIMGVVGTYCALIYPVFDPYEFPHITGFSFLIGHYALLVNSLNVIFNSYKIASHQQAADCRGYLITESSFGNR